MFTKPVPYRPAISDVLIKASANSVFRKMLLASPYSVLAEMNLPPEDIQILASVKAPTLKEYASQLKMQLIAN